MSNVTLHIGGRTFAVACADGEEGHIAALGRLIDGKLASMGDMTGQSEARMLLFAALLMADELHEARSNAPAGGGDGVSEELAEELAEQLGIMADRLENLASRLEG